MNTIAIDCGASFIKGALVSSKGVILAQNLKPSPAIYSDNNILEPVWISTLFLMVQEMVEDLAKDEKEVKLCLSNEMHGFILALKDGTPYTDYISWQREYGSIKCNRKNALEILGADKYKEDIFKSGMPLRAGMPSCNLLFLERYGYLKKIKGDLLFYTLGDYLISRFTEQPSICHPTNAAATGLYDLREARWNKNLIHCVCEENIRFPEVGSSIITITKKDVIYHVYPAIGDQQAALLGAGLENEQEISFNLGTGSQVSIVSEKPDLGHGYQIRPYFKGKYLKTIPHLPSGRALNVYIRFFEDVFKQFQITIDREEIWQILLKSAELTDTSNLKCDMSFFENAVTNHNVGSITHIGEFDLSVGALMRGALDQMVENFLWAADKITSNGNTIKTILFSGGVAKKIEFIRNMILLHYPDAAVVKVASDETLIGLYRYGAE